MSRRHRGKRKKPSAPEPMEETRAPGRLEALGARAAGIARSRWSAPLVLAALVLAVYARSIDDPLIYWDDNLYVLEDARVRELSLSNAWKILTGSFAANYHPLTTFTFALDRAIWGEWLAGFHLTQLVFYAGGVVLLYWVFRAVLGSAPAAFAGAAIYATHTIHVESVAWLASRKDVVCLFFYAAAILAYFRYVREKDRPYRYYALFASLAAAAMFSKGYAAALPAVLLAYDACFAERFRWRLVLDKIPLFALGAALTLVMIAAQEKDATPAEGIRMAQKIVPNCKIYAVYVGRMVLPVGLSINYNYVTRPDWLSGWVAALGAALGAATVAGLFVLRRRLPAAAFGIALFLLQLGTVMSTFFTLRQWMTDRYLFFPTIGSTVALAAGGLWLYGKKSVPAAGRLAIPAAAAAAVALYSALTIARLGDWRSEVHIWSDAVRKQMGLEGSGPLDLRELHGKGISDIGSLQKVQQAYERAGRKNEARRFMEVIGRLEGRTTGGDDVKLAQHEMDAKRYDDAIRRLTPIAEEGRFRAPDAWKWIGEAYKRQGKRPEARAAWEKALELYRESGRSGAEVMTELGTLEFEAGRYGEAAGWYSRAREHAKATDPRPVFYLGLTLERMGKLEEAYGLCEEALALEGKAPAKASFSFADVCLEMGTIAEGLGRPADAADHFEEAMRRAPGHPQGPAIRARITTLRRRPPR